jgi:hypothetical protein
MHGRIFAISGVVAMCLATGLVRAQQRPDFSGTWVATKDAAPSVATASSPVLYERFAIKHAGQTMQMFRPTDGRAEPWVTTHTLDGAETRVMLPGNTCFGQSGQVVTTTWDGTAIAYTIIGSLSPGSTTPRPVSLKYAFKLAAPDTLVIETTRGGSATAAPTTVATVYKRSSDPLPAPDTTAKPTAAPATIADVGWITGTWTGTMGTRAIEERWLNATAGSMLATSRTTLASGVMVAFEFLCIVERDGSLVYTAMPNAAPPTHFVLTKIDADSATFENPSHDFPKMIRYVRKPDGTMEATISGAPDRRPTTFVFKK